MALLRRLGLSLVLLAILAAGAAARDAGSVDSSGRTVAGRTSGRRARPPVPDVRSGSALRVAQGKSSVPAATFNLMNNVAGAGLLTLSSAMAMGVGVYPACALCLFIGSVSAHTFALVNRACVRTGETSFRGLCTMLLGPEVACISTAALVMLCFSVCVVYGGFIGDMATSLLAAPVGLAPELNHRTVNILVGTASVLLPLCLQRSLDKLAFTSVLGLCSVIYSVAFIVLRSLDGTYAPGGRFYEDLAALGAGFVPNFDEVGPWKFDSRAMVLMSNLGVSFMAHYNAPKYFSELRNPTIRRCDMVSWPSYLGLSLIYAITMVAGYRTFGKSCRTLLLTNYSSKDRLGDIARIATGFSILFGFPLIFCGLRQGVVDTSVAILALRRDRKGKERMLDRALRAVANATKTDRGFERLTFAILACTTSLAVLVKDMGIVVGIAGAVVGSYFIYVLPTLLYTILKSHDGKLTPSKTMNLVLVPAGLCMAVMGVYMNIKTRM